MKKLFFPIITGILFLLTAPLALAQEATPVPEAQLADPTATETPAATEITLNSHHDAILEYFLAQAAKGYFGRAYSLTSRNFRAFNSKTTFEALLQATGLNAPNTKKWISQESSGKRNAIARGEFTDSNNKTHLLTFLLRPHRTLGIQIEGISEQLTMADLSARAPTGEVFTALLNKDLVAISGHVHRRLAKSTYKYLSSAARQRTKLSDIRAAYASFKEQGYNIDLPSNGQIQLAQDFPRLNDQGQLLVSGTYQNATHNVNFTFAYDYEWEWKLGVFSYNASALTR